MQILQIHWSIKEHHQEVDLSVNVKTSTQSVSVAAAPRSQTMWRKHLKIGGECEKTGVWVGGRILLEKILFHVTKCLCFVCCTVSSFKDAVISSKSTE